MDMYRNTVTGEVFTVDESREAYEEFEWDFRLEYDSFEDWFAEMIKKGDFEKVAQGQTSNKKKEKRDERRSYAARCQKAGGRTPGVAQKGAGSDPDGRACPSRRNHDQGSFPAKKKENSEKEKKIKDDFIQRR